MSIFNELKDSHDALKAIALNALLMPFWYASIYLFNNQFYKSGDTIIITVMCFILSISSSSILTHIALMVQDSLNKNPEKKEHDTVFNNMIFSIFFSMHMAFTVDSIFLFIRIFF
jgi:hypothetical protein